MGLLGSGMADLGVVISNKSRISGEIGKHNVGRIEMTKRKQAQSYILIEIRMRTLLAKVIMPATIDSRAPYGCKQNS